MLYRQDALSAAEPKASEQNQTRAPSECHKPAASVQHYMLTYFTVHRYMMDKITSKKMENKTTQTDSMLTAEINIQH